MRRCEEVSVKVSMCVSCDGVDSTLFSSACIQCSVWTCDRMNGER